MTERGFSDVAVQSAHAFRSIMQAMARPGRVIEIDADVAAPEPLLPSTAAVVLTLCDFQTPVWLAPALSNHTVAQYLRFHAGCPISAGAAAAQFVVATPGDVLPEPSSLLQGTHEYPDRSATLVLQVGGFRAGDVELAGPGIRDRQSFGVEGLNASFWDAMAENHSRFPVGVDVIFVSHGLIAALPRSTAVRLLEPI